MQNWKHYQIEQSEVNKGSAIAMRQEEELRKSILMFRRALDSHSAASPFDFP